MQDYNSSAIHALKRELFRAQAKSDFSNMKADRQSAFELDAGNNPAADVHFSDELLGKSPALRVWPDGASSDRAVYYLHGGGFILGAPSTQRGMLGELSRSADAHVIALDYSKAPERTFPAAYNETISGLRAMQRINVPFAVETPQEADSLWQPLPQRRTKERRHALRLCSVPGWT